MFMPFKVWDTNHEFGDVTIAQFAVEEDAVLFAKTKATKNGGYNTGMLVGQSYNTRRLVPVD
jgi:hypothetical protein